MNRAHVFVNDNTEQTETWAIQKVVEIVSFCAFDDGI